MWVQGGYKMTPFNMKREVTDITIVWVILPIYLFCHQMKYNIPTWIRIYKIMGQIYSMYVLIFDLIEIWIEFG